MEEACNPGTCKQYPAMSFEAAAAQQVKQSADVVIPAHDRFRLERLLRYGLRPPVAIDRLSGLPDGRLFYRLKLRWKDGTTLVIYEPLELMEKLAALVPPPRFNLVRYSGLFASSSKLRKRIIPAKPAIDSVDEFLVYKHLEKPSLSSQSNINKCDRCGGRMRILCAILPPGVIRKILDCLGIPYRPTPIFPAVLENSTEECIN